MQLALTFPEVKQRGGARLGAGRKRRLGRRPAAHRARPKLSRHHPVHVVIRLVPGQRSMRSRRLFGRVHRALSDAKGGSRRSGGVRIVHYSVQSNHIHLIVEAVGAKALANGMRSLGIRLARRLNPVLGRRGRLIGERYHATQLRSPLQVKHALAYVLNNGRKHLAQQGRLMSAGWLDPCASGRYFPHWQSQPGDVVHMESNWVVQLDARAGPSVLAPQSWLLTTGWLRHGAIELSWVPGVPGVPG